MKAMLRGPEIEWKAGIARIKDGKSWEGRKKDFEIVSLVGCVHSGFGLRDGISRWIASFYYQLDN